METLHEGKRLRIELVDGPSISEICRLCHRPIDGPYHVNSCVRRDEVPPARSLGGELCSIIDVRKWLGHPSNQFVGDMFIVKWDGCVPTISRDHVERLFTGDGLAKAILYGHTKIKRGRADAEVMIDRGE